MKNTFNSIMGSFLLLTATALPGTHAHAQESNADIYGTWKIKALIGGGIGSLTDRQARHLIGKPLIINAERYEFNGEVCLHPNYVRTKDNPDTYFDREWRTDASDIPFPNPMTIIETEGCDFLYLIRKDHLMIAESGGFFEAVRVKDRPRKAASVSRR